MVSEAPHWNQQGLLNIGMMNRKVLNIRLTLQAEWIRLEIEDNGRGIPKKHLNHLNQGAAGVGVGIAGMRERMRELGGSVEIHSELTGTKVIVTIPVLEKV
jgi:signal transduction histidine kinase